MDLYSQIKVNNSSVGFLGGYFSESDNPEFMAVYLDKDDKIIKAIKSDGTEYLGLGVEVNGKISIESGADITIIENPEFVAVWLDDSNKIIFGLQSNGDIKFGFGIPSLIEDYITEREQIIKDTYGELIDNPEWIYLTTDSETRIIEGIKTDGTKVFRTPIETPKVDIKGFAIESIDDLEKRYEITLDSDDKILSYRSEDGLKVETVGIKTNHLELTQTGMTDFLKALKDSGFRAGAGDWSDYISNDGDNPLCLPEPRYAIVNFITENGLPTAKNQNIRGYVDYNDMNGNHFRKKAILNGQGSSSIQYNNQKNIAVDLFDEDWDGDAFSLKIGNWVSLDSFHIKTFYMDPVRGLADVCYKYAEYVIQQTNTRPNRLAREDNKVTVNSDTGVITNDYNTGALCHPDGFPCLVYSNGDFMGIYAWNLKKHRSNYMMDKKDYESVMIDPEYCNLWNLNPINWANMEIRNPKTLYCMDGSKYDGDNPKELIDSTSEYYDATNKDHNNTIKTKNIIVGLHDAVLAINSASTSAAKKALFEQTFDLDGLIIFWIVSQFMDNWDGMRDRNTQWLYYKKSGKWCPSFYDLDNCIGYCGFPWLDNPHTSLVQAEYYSENLVNTWVWQLYHDEIVTRYNSLRQSGVISTDAYMKFYNEWCSRIDSSYIKINAEKWDVPCYRDGKIDTEHWKQIGYVRWGEVTYDENTDYSVGDEVNYGNGTYIRGPFVIKFKCIKACKGMTPCGSYPNMPLTGGTFDSPRRVKAWLDAKIEILDTLIH